MRIVRERPRRVSAALTCIPRVALRATISKPPFDLMARGEIKKPSANRRKMQASRIAPNPPFDDYCF
jgi:hypothetical protein